MITQKIRDGLVGGVQSVTQEPRERRKEVERERKRTLARSNRSRRWRHGGAEQEYPAGTVRWHSCALVGGS